MRVYNNWVSIIILLTSLSVALFPFEGLAETEENRKKVYEQLNLFGEVFDRVRSTHVEAVNSQDLIRAAIDGMLSSLDPHSGYLAPESFQDMQVDTKGAFGGLGIEVTQEDGFVKVVSPMDGTPAFEAGIKAGDFITHVDSEATLGLTLAEAVEKMRGPVGSEILLTIVRVGETDPLEIIIVRDVIKLTAAKVRSDDKVIIIRVTTFNEQTTPNIKDGIKTQLAKLGGLKNITGFVLDLRNNPGGLLSEAISVTDMFLSKGEIVSTRGRIENDGERYNATSGDLAEGKPIVLIINGGSASASEIVAGALQDHKRAIVMGTKSFGKGSVQSILPIGKEGAIRLTTARYYTPSGRSIQSLGVSPDIIVAQKTKPSESENDKNLAGRKRLTESDLRGALSNDSLNEEEKKQMELDRARQEKSAAMRLEDYQMAYALDIIKGLNIYNNENLN
ncbi:S41 family peptidase [Rhodobacteraceae bacterium]|nr:S41 family peptidase [Paracoccaceae bacterium]